MQLLEDPRTLPLAIFLLQVFLTLIVCKLFAKILSYIRQPQVIGQIIVGIIFGPSVLGHIQGWSNTVWPVNSLKTFSLVANLGLIFFLFFLGLELDLQQLKRSWKITLPVAAASIIIPVGIGCAFSLWLYDLNDGFGNSKIAFILLIGSGFGFSAFPVLATLLNSLGLLNKPIGIQTISLAAVEDIIVWIVLAIASAFSMGDTALKGVYTLLLTLGFIVTMLCIIRPILARLHGFYLRRSDDTNVYLVVCCFLLLIVASFTTEVMGIHAFFGAFIGGLCIPREGQLADFLAIRIELIIVEFFLPLYFANSGLQTHLNLLNEGKIWWILVILIMSASIAKIIPVTLATKYFSKRPWLFCLSMGVLMNTRGIVQLVVLNIGVSLGIISPKLFALFVLMATILTFLISPSLHLLFMGSAEIRKSTNIDVDHNLAYSHEEAPCMINDSNTNALLKTINEENQSEYESKRGSMPTPTVPRMNIPMLTLNDRLSHPNVGLHPEGRRSTIFDQLAVFSPITPHRSIIMTRF